MADKEFCDAEKLYAHQLETLRTTSSNILSPQRDAAKLILSVLTSDCDWQTVCQQLGVPPKYFNYSSIQNLEATLAEFDVANLIGELSLRPESKFDKLMEQESKMACSWLTNAKKRGRSQVEDALHESREEAPHTAALIRTLDRAGTIFSNQNLPPMAALAAYVTLQLFQGAKDTIKLMVQCNEDALLHAMERTHTYFVHLAGRELHYKYTPCEWPTLPRDLPASAEPAAAAAPQAAAAPNSAFTTFSNFPFQGEEWTDEVLLSGQKGKRAKTATFPELAALLFESFPSDFSSVVHCPSRGDGNCATLCIAALHKISNGSITDRAALVDFLGFGAQGYNRSAVATTIEDLRDTNPDSAMMLCLKGDSFDDMLATIRNPQGHAVGEDMAVPLWLATTTKVAVVEVKLYSAWAAKPRLLVKAYRSIGDPVARCALMYIGKEKRATDGTTYWDGHYDLLLEK